MDHQHPATTASYHHCWRATMPGQTSMAAFLPGQDPTFLPWQPTAWRVRLDSACGFIQYMDQPAICLYGGVGGLLPPPLALTCQLFCQNRPYPLPSMPCCMGSQHTVAAGGSSTATTGGLPVLHLACLKRLCHAMQCPISCLQDGRWGGTPAWLGLHTRLPAKLGAATAATYPTLPSHRHTQPCHCYLPNRPAACRRLVTVSAVPVPYCDACSALTPYHCLPTTYYSPPGQPSQLPAIPALGRLDRLPPWPTPYPTHFTATLYLYSR